VLLFVHNLIETIMNIKYNLFYFVGTYNNRTKHTASPLESLCWVYAYHVLFLPKQHFTSMQVLDLPLLFETKAHTHLNED
jgi:hypothetical protein